MSGQSSQVSTDRSTPEKDKEVLVGGSREAASPVYAPRVSSGPSSRCVHGKHWGDGRDSSLMLPN